MTAVRTDRFYVVVGGKRIPFKTPTDPRYAVSDCAECELCGAVVDVGGALYQHASEHVDA